LKYITENSDVLAAAISAAERLQTNKQPNLDIQESRQHDKKLRVPTIKGSAMAPLPKPKVEVIRSLDDKGFIVAMRRAITRDEKVKAITSYCGFSLREDFGVQELRAMNKAKKALSKAPVVLDDKKYTRGASHSLGGYIAGLPSTEDRKVKEIQMYLTPKRIELIDAAKNLTQKIIELENKSLDKRLSSFTRQAYAGEALLEKARLEAIKKDLQ
jgi:hypothetical protein